MTTPSSALHNFSATRDVASDPGRIFATVPVTEADPVTLELRLLQSLARLHTLDAQLKDLRTLLPCRLLASLNPILRPRSAASVPAPSILLQQFEKGARGGLKEVEAFKRGWKDGEMAKVWNRARTAEEDGGAGLVQGNDTWDVEYQDMVKGRQERNKTSKIEGRSPGDGEKKMDGGRCCKQDSQAWSLSPVPVMKRCDSIAGTRLARGQPFAVTIQDLKEHAKVTAVV